MLDCAQGVAPRDGRSKCPTGSRIPVMAIVYFDVQGVIDLRDGHCLL